MKYRKKPVVIEAVKWGGMNDAELLALAEGSSCELEFDSDSTKLVVRTLEGRMLALPGDYIIRGIKGELYPCKADIFEATYEAVET